MPLVLDNRLSRVLNVIFIGTILIHFHIKMFQGNYSVKLVSLKGAREADGMGFEGMRPTGAGGFKVSAGCGAFANGWGAWELEPRRI